VVIGEPQRALYGNQLGLTFPLFMHYQVPLWVPEVGGPVIPGSEAHDLVRQGPVRHRGRIDPRRHSLPSAADPRRNLHRTGVAWSKSAIKAILANPRYTGHQVWNKQRRDEVLIDVDDVALGHQTKLRWNQPDQWI
jgi:Recombinase